jgi:excisionase family DNA binding protein
MARCQYQERQEMPGVITEIAPQPEISGAPLMLRVEEAAKLSGLGRTKFLELLYAGEVPGVARFGRAVRVNRRMLEQWLDERSAVTTRQSA